MTYQETLDWMFSQLPMYQKQGASAFKGKLGLQNIVDLVSYLEHPEQQFKSIHVGGTNGKGSTSHMLASILQESGYTVGLYTSPHLKDFRERIRVNGEKISEDDVIDFIKEHKAYFESHQLSFFEMTVGMAFQYFARVKVDVAIIEVGLGGRLDSTNIITPEVAVITNIGLDHTQFLGTTLPEIAGEKAGIIKQGIPTVIGRTTPETKAVFDAKAKEEQSPVYYAFNYEEIVYPSDLKGNYQEENKRTVLQTINVLQSRGWKIKETAIQQGLQSVVQNTGLLGRWQVLQETPKVICDTAHNEDGLRLVMNQLQSEEYEQLHIVLGVVKDKSLEDILPLFPETATYYFVAPKLSRGLDAKILKQNAKNFGLHGSVYSSVKEAYATALQLATVSDLVYVGGSTFVVAEII